MNSTYTTRLKLDNTAGLYPCLQVVWHRRGNTWIGDCQRWKDGDTRQGARHQVSVSQSIPLGTITVDFDGTKGGSWKSHSFEGSRFDERDLQWATAWAALALENKLQVFPDEVPYEEGAGR